MPDPVTVGGVVGGSAVVAYLSKDGLNKLLGPTADYLGENLKDFVEKRHKNIDNIFQRAQAKLGNKINEPGTVPPRVLKSIIDDGSFTEDSLAAEYYGGVLANSRTEAGVDDRGVRIAKKISELSSYQIRAHYVIYNLFKHLCANHPDSTTSLATNRSKLKAFMPAVLFVHLMKFSSTDVKVIDTLLPHIFGGLENEGLIANNWGFGSPASLKKFGFEAPQQGLVVEPTLYGAELFVWAFGNGDSMITDAFTEFAKTQIDEIPLVFANSAFVSDLKSN